MDLHFAENNGLHVRAAGRPAGELLKTIRRISAGLLSSATVVHSLDCERPDGDDDARNTAVPDTC